MLVATASLELGIDVGTVDLVVQINSPRAIAVTLQRVGRSGHWRGAVPKGRFFATTRDELMECAALVRAIRQGDLDRLIIPDAPLDILAQQIVAACSAEEWDEDELFALAQARISLSQSNARQTFDRSCEMLSEGIAASRGRYGAYLHRDRVNGKLRARRGARLAAITSGGAIPETALYTVVAEPEGMVVGTLDEDFAVESSRATSCCWATLRGAFAASRPTPGACWWRTRTARRPTFLSGAAKLRRAPRSLSQHVGKLRQEISDLLAATLRPWDFAIQQAGGG